MTVTIDVYEADSTTLVDSIDAGQWRSARFGEVNSGPGGYKIVFPNLIDAGVTNPALALLTTGRLIRFSVDGTARFQGIVEDRGIEVVSPQEEAGETTTLTGRGTLAIFDKVKVRPDRGTGNLPWHPTRWFNFAADRLRDDDAAGPQGIWPLGYGQLPNYDTDNYFGRPEGFTDTAGPAGTGPEWIWEDDTRTAFADAGVVYFRQRFTLASETDALIEFAADDEGELWIDDVPICKTEGVYLGSCVKAGIRLSTGEHLISGVGRNLNALRAGVVFAGWSVSDGMPDTLLFRSDSTLCLVLAYPTDPPGFTATEIPRLVVDEVQSLTDPRLGDVTFSFISASDTDSAAMTEVVDVACKAPGDSIMTLLMLLGETYLDLGMEPDALELNAWIRGTRGSDLSGTIAFAKGTCRWVSWDIGGAERATVALVSGNMFAPFEVEHADAATTSVYEEVSLDFGDASEEAATRFASDYLDLVSQGRQGVTLELIPDVGPTPYEDFGIGDTISIPGPDGSAEDHRVVGIGCEVNADSITRWSLELDQPRAAIEERLDAIMRRQLPGSAGGRTVLPAPIQPQFVANQQGQEDEHSWQWDGPLGEIQVYKNGTAITGAVVDASDLTTAGDSAKTTITDAARKYTKESDVFQIEAGGSGNLSPDYKPTKGRWLQEVRATCSANDDGDHITITLKFA